MALTNIAGKSITAFSGKAAKTGILKSLGAAGKGVLKSLGLTNPVTAALIGADIILTLLLSKWLAPDAPEKPLRYSALQARINPARWPLGKKLRLEGQTVWGSVIYGPGSRGQPSDETQFKYFDNHLRLIIVIAEAGKNGIEGLVDTTGTRGNSAVMWSDNRRILLTKKAGTTNEWNGGRRVNGLGVGVPGITTAFPQPNVFRVREYLSGDGVVPADIQIDNIAETKYVTSAEEQDYNYFTSGMPIEDDPDTGTWYTQSQYDALDESVKNDLTQVATRQRIVTPGQPDSFGKPIKISETEWPWTSNHKLQGKAYLVVDIIQPFHNEQDADDDLFKQIPKLEFLISGIKFTWPGQTTPISSSNAVAQMYWYDTERIGIPAASIDTTEFTKAYNRAEETITVDASDIPANLSELRSIRQYKYGESHTVVQSGESPDAVWSRLRAKITGWRFPLNGKIVYRAGDDETSRLTLEDDDFIDSVECDPIQGIESRFTRLTVHLPQSERNNYEPETLVYDAGTAAVTRAGRVRNLDIEMDCCVNMLDAGHKAAILYRQATQSFTFKGLIRKQPNMAHLGLIPGDAITVTNEELGLVARKCIVLANEFGSGFESILTLSLDEGGVYADTLTLPPVRDRMLEFSDRGSAAEFRDLALAAHAETQRDGSILNFLTATWAPTNALSTEVRYRRRQSIWTAPVAEANGILYRSLAMTPFTIGNAGSGADHETASANRWGIWLQYQYGPIGTDVPQYQQMAGGEDGDNSILDTGAPLQIFRRFGIYATDADSGSTTVFANRTVLQLSDEGTTGISDYDFTADQVRDWRILFRDSAGATFLMNLPQSSEDTDNPYLWDDGIGLRTFLQTAKTNNRMIDAAIVDTGVTGIDAASATALLQAEIWRPMPVAENTAEVAGVAEGDAYAVQGRHTSTDGNRGSWANSTLLVSGDLTPPGQPTELQVEGLPLAFHVSFRRPDDLDIAFFEIGISDTDGGPIEVVAETPGTHYTSGSNYTDGIQKYVQVRAVDRRGNRGPWSAADDFTPTGIEAGASIYFVDIAPTAMPVAGTTELVSGGMIPAASEIPTGSVVIDTSDGRVWEWDDDTDAFILRATVKGTDFQIGDVIPTTCVPHSIRMDGDGSIFQCNADGDGEIFTGIRVPTSQALVPYDSGGRRIWPVESWPPAPDVGQQGDGAYAPNGEFGSKSAGGWPGQPLTFGEATESFSVYIIETDADLPDYPLLPSGTAQAVTKTHIRISLDDGVIHKWNPNTGNWANAGTIFAAAVAGPTVPFPLGLSWSPPTRNANGTYTSTASLAAQAGVVSRDWRLVPATATRTSGNTSDTELTVSDLPADTTTTIYWKNVNASGIRSAENSVSVSTGAATAPLASVPRSFAAAVTATSGDTRFTWQLPTTNANLITSWTLEIRQGGALYRRMVIAVPTAVAQNVLALPSGTYSASLVPNTQGGPGTAATIASFVVPVRTSDEFPPPRNMEYGSFLFDDSVSARSNLDLPVDWDHPVGKVPTGYRIWCGNNRNASTALPAQTMRSLAPTSTSNTFNTGVQLKTILRRNYVTKMVAEYTGGSSAVVEVSKSLGSPPSGSTPAPTGLTITPSATTEGNMSVAFTRPAATAPDAFTSAEVLLLSHSGDRLIDVQLINAAGNQTEARVLTANFTGVRTGIQMRVEARLYSYRGQSPAVHQQYTLQPLTLTTVPTPIGLGSRDKTSNGITITGPGAFPGGVNAAEWYVALRSTPGTPLAAYPRTTVTSSPFVNLAEGTTGLALTGFANNMSYVFRYRYRSGPSGSRVFGNYGDVYFAYGTADTPPPANPTSLTITVSSTVQGSVAMDCPDVTGATSYRFEYKPLTGGGTTVGMTVTASNHTFTGVARGSWTGTAYAIGPGGQSVGGISRNFDVTRLDIPTNPPPAPLRQVPVILISSNYGFRHPGYLITAAWGNVQNAATYLWEWRYDLSSAERTALLNANSNAPTRNILHSRGETAGFISQIDLTIRQRIENRVYTLFVRPKASDGTIGPSLPGFHVIEIPVLSAPSTGRIIEVLDVLIDHDSINISFGRIRGTPTVGRYVYRTRTETGTMDLTAQSGTFTGAARLAIENLTRRTIYRTWIRGQVGSSGAGALLPEVQLTYQTALLPNRRPATGAGGQSETTVLQIWVNPFRPIVPPADLGRIGDTCILLNDGSHWRKTRKGWTPTVLPHEN